jgi:hypothetical protein
VNLIKSSTFYKNSSQQFRLEFHHSSSTKQNGEHNKKN